MQVMYAYDKNKRYTVYPRDIVRAETLTGAPVHGNLTSFSLNL